MTHLLASAMIPPLPAKMKPTTLTVLSLLLSILTPSIASGDSQPPGTAVQAQFSADDFDWREMVPYLFEAAALPGEQGIRTMLENTRVLRVYIANQARTQCSQDSNSCGETNQDISLPDADVSKRIEEIVHEKITSQHRTAIVDVPLAHQPFPFSEIAALRDEKHSDAYLILQFSDHSYTASQLQSKYGAPYDTNIFQWYSVFTYRKDSRSYSSKAVFEINPVDGTVIRVSVSLKRKPTKSLH